MIELITALCLLWGGFAVSAAHAFAGYTVGYAPSVYPPETATHYGQGVYFAMPDLTVYEAPSAQAAVIDSFHWGAEGRNSMVYASESHRYVPATSLFICFYPQAGLALMATEGDSPDGGWSEVVIDHETGETGWVKLRDPETAAVDAAGKALPAHMGRMQNWLTFMRLNGIANGIEWLRGVPAYQRALRMAPEDSAKIIPTTLIRRLKVKHVRGNWLLVEVVDFARQAPVGWIRWRDDAGNLLVFPDFTQRQAPVLTTTMF